MGSSNLKNLIVEKLDMGYDMQEQSRHLTFFYIENEISTLWTGHENFFKYFFLLYLAIGSWLLVNRDDVMSQNLWHNFLVFKNLFH